MALVVITIAWIGAIAAVALWALPPWAVPACLAAASPATLLLRGRRDAIVLAAAALLALAGATRFDLWRGGAAPDLAHFLARSVTVEGIIASEPDPGETIAAYEVSAHRIETFGYAGATSGLVRIAVDQYARYLPGDHVRLRGPLQPAPVFKDFNYRSYLARRGVVGVMANPEVTLIERGQEWSPARMAARLRLALDSGLQRSLPEPEASLAGGIAFGRDGNLPQELYDAFRDTGLAHIVAVSGANVTLVMAVVFLLAVRAVGRRLALFPAALTVVAYLFVAGLSASVVRAGIMAIVYLAGTYLGRQQSALAALGAAVIVMTMAQPGAALDLGFQLSLAATAGLIAFGPWLRYAIARALRGSRAGSFVPGVAIQAAALTLSATLATMPITWVNFGRVSLIGPLANVVIEPVFVLAFWLSAATAALGAAWQPAGWFVGLAAYYPLTFMTWFARSAAAIPGAAIDVPRANGTTAFLAFVAVCAVGWPAYRYLPPEMVPLHHLPRPRRVLRMAVAAGAVSCIALVALPVSLLPLRGPGELQMAVLDVGQGDAVLFTTPSGRHVLVDGGPSGIQLSRELGAVLPHWSRSIDALFVTLPQDEHAGALPEAIRRFDVGRVFDAGNGAARVALPGGAAGPGPTALRAGGNYELDGVHFEVLWPGTTAGTATNDNALVLAVTYGQTRFILASNLSAKSQQALTASAIVSADVLVVPHHGANKTDAPFIATVQPALAVIPRGTGRFVPGVAADVSAALAGAMVLRTDRDGRLLVASDGRSIAFETQR